MDYQARTQRNANPLEMGLLQLPTRPTSIYTQGMRKAAIDECEVGKLRLAADLTLAAITESAYCRGILADLVEGLWGLPRHWSGDPEMIAALDDTPARVGQFSVMFPQPDSIRLMSWGITLGVGLGQMRRKYARPSYDFPVSLDEAANGVWKAPSAMARPIGAHDTRVLHTWSPKYLRHQWWDDSWWLLTADGECRVAPLDDSPCLDQWGNVDAAAQRGNSDEWMLYTPYGRHRPWEWGAWKSATQAFIGERDAAFDRWRHAEVLGPMRVGEVPQGTTERQRKAYLKQIQEMRRLGILIMPPGLNYKLVESTGRVTQVYKDIIDAAHQEYAMITGAITTAEGNKGFARGDVQERFTRGILSAFGNSFFECAHRGAIVPWGRENYGSEDAPRPGCDAAAPEDKKVRAETLGLAADGLTKMTVALRDAGLRLTRASVEKEAQRLGLEVESVPVGEAKAAQIDLAPTDKAKAFRVREVRAGEGYPPLGTIDAPDPRDDLTLAEMDALAKPKQGAPPGGNHGDVNENGPIVAENEAHVEPMTDEATARLAADMTAAQLEQCEHERPNRCLLCGVERLRGFTVEPGTNVVRWHRAWQPIVRARPAPAFVASVGGGLPVRVYSGIRIRIDRPKGFVQTGTGANGATWERVYHVDYGFIDGTRGGDREEFDVFCGPDRHAPQAFVAVQTNLAGRFDEYKHFLGFDGIDAARSCYVAHIPPAMLAGMFALPVEALRGFLGLEPRAKNALALSRLNGVAHLPAWAPGGEA